MNMYINYDKKYDNTKAIFKTYANFFNIAFLKFTFSIHL